MRQKIFRVEAQNVCVGDFIYDKGYFASDKWVRVKQVIIDISGRITFDVGYCLIGTFHARQGKAIKRSIVQ